MSLDGLSLFPLVTEIHSALAGGRIEKIFQTDNFTITMLVRMPGKTLRLMLSANPQNPSLYLSAANPQNPDTPPAFCMLLRKHLEDGRISGLVQHTLDRIVTLHVDVREERGAIVTKSLVLELMGKHSNIIFLQDGMIIDSIKRVGPAMSRHRLVLPGREYAAPPGQNRINLLTTNPAVFLQMLVANQTGSLQKAIINTAIGIGPITAKEILWRAGLTGITVEDLDGQKLIMLEKAILSITHLVSQGDICPEVRLDEHRRVLGFAAFPLKHLSQFEAYQFDAMSKAIEFINQLEVQHVPEQGQLLKFVGGEINRLRRKKEVLLSDLTNAEMADELRKYADILMAHLPVIKQGAQQAELPDLYSDEPDKKLVIELDPHETPLRNAQIYYTKYNKLKRARDNIRTQLENTEAEIQYLESVHLAIEQAVLLKEVKEIRQELIAGEYIAQAGKRKPEPPSSPMMITSEDGSTIYVGKNNRQNDIVTFKYARPDDFWFHTKDIPGSHVILHSNGKPDQQALVQAAQLAAYFSKAKHSANVPVDYTRRRYVKKPSGAKPGFVIYDHQNTLYVTPDEALVKTLLTD